MTALIRYDAARRAIASAYRVDEAKKIRDKAEAVRVYAKQARDLDMQNMAAEIRIRAERRAGQLLLEMEKNPGTRGAGRPRKDGSRITWSKTSTANTPKLGDIGVTKDQSSKWQRLAMLVNDGTFERALAQAREKNGELTNAALLREIKEIVTPVGTVVEPDINVIAAELARELASATRRQKLEEVVRLRNRLNSTIRKSLMLALKNATTDASNFEAQLAADFQDIPANGKCHQRVIRERMADQPEPDLEEKRKLAADFRHAIVREISYDEARNVVLSNEYLGSMGTSEWNWGLFFGSYLAGVCCFGRTAGTRVAESVCGAEHAHRVVSLVRGACLHWSHPHSGSFLVSAACREISKKGFHVVVAYADPAAGEQGVILRACNFVYCGMTNAPQKFKTPDGKLHDSRQIHCLTRDRTGGTMKYRRSRAEQKQILLANGCEFFEGTPKHRFVGIFGDRRIKKILRRALKWEVRPYPRASSLDNQVEILDRDPVPKTFAASVS
jgi:hypothetical protein